MDTEEAVCMNFQHRERVYSTTRGFKLLAKYTVDFEGEREEEKQINTRRPITQTAHQR